MNSRCDRQNCLGRSTIFDIFLFLFTFSRARATETALYSQVYSAAKSASFSCDLVPRRAVRSDTCVGNAIAYNIACTASLNTKCTPLARQIPAPQFKTKHDKYAHTYTTPPPPSPFHMTTVVLQPDLQSITRRRIPKSCSITRHPNSDTESASDAESAISHLVMCARDARNSTNARWRSKQPGVLLCRVFYDDK